MFRSHSGNSLKLFKGPQPLPMPSRPRPQRSQSESQPTSPLALYAVPPFSPTTRSMDTLSLNPLHSHGSYRRYKSRDSQSKPFVKPFDESAFNTLSPPSKRNKAPIDLSNYDLDENEDGINGDVEEEDNHFAYGQYEMLSGDLMVNRLHPAVNGNAISDLPQSPSTLSFLRSSSLDTGLRLNSYIESNSNVPKSSLEPSPEPSPEPSSNDENFDDNEVYFKSTDDIDYGDYSVYLNATEPIKQKKRMSERLSIFQSKSRNGDRQRSETVDSAQRDRVPLKISKSDNGPRATNQSSPWYKGIFSKKTVSPSPSTMSEDERKDINEDSVSESRLPPIFGDFPLNHRQITESILEFKGLEPSECDFESDAVNVFRAQCARVSYSQYVPKIADLFYPQILSSLCISRKTQNESYTVRCCYDISSLKAAAAALSISTENVEHKEDDHDIALRLHSVDIDSLSVNDGVHTMLFHQLLDSNRIGNVDSKDIQSLDLHFDHSTTTQQAIQSVWTLICESTTNGLRAQFQRLNVDHFVLGIRGREEYLRFDDNPLIVSSEYIRRALRNREDIGKNMEFALFYVVDIDLYDEEQFRTDLEEWYALNTYSRAVLEEFVPRKSGLKSVDFESLGYHCILPVLHQTAGTDRNVMSEVVEAVEGEVARMRSEISALSKSSTSSSMPTAVLMEEFEHPIELRICSLNNIVNAPRFKLRADSYSALVLRIELMFGDKVFEAASWDIVISKDTVCESIEFDIDRSVLSTERSPLNYAVLPREATWCFTVYGIRRNGDHSEDDDPSSPPSALSYLASVEDTRTNLEHDDLLSIRSEFQKFNGPQSDSVKRAKSKESKESAKSEISEISISLTIDSEIPRDGSSVVVDDTSSTESKWCTEPLAWGRCGVVDHRHCLHRGAFTFHLWSIPEFVAVKGGPKVDPYSTRFWRKFGSTSTPKGDDDVMLSVEFGHFPFNVVAMMVNPILNGNQRLVQIRDSVSTSSQTKTLRTVLEVIRNSNVIDPLNGVDRTLVLSHGSQLTAYPEALATYLRSVDWLDIEHRMEALGYLERWSLPIAAQDAIELLRCEFADSRIRLYAVHCLNRFDDYTLNRYLLQLVQALKSEVHHSSFLSHFLLFRAQRSPQQIGHYLFWHFLAEYSADCQWRERFGVLIEDLLLHSVGNLERFGVHFAADLLVQHRIMKRLTRISERVQLGKSSKVKSSAMELQQFVVTEMSKVNEEIRASQECLHRMDIPLPLDPAQRVCAINADRCEFMSSAKVPLWLSFRCSERFGDTSNLEALFKCGDDLRQDILTLQLIAVMDALWTGNGGDLDSNSELDLRLRPYRVIPTGALQGMVELVLSARTTNEIHTVHGVIRGNFNERAHSIYLHSNAPLTSDDDEEGMERRDQIEENYARSAAGYSVATWVLGIADRHPSNIMIHEDGGMFHIDFGHFLGNFKEKQLGIGNAKMTWNRERSPFIFTSIMKYAIDRGDDDSVLYKHFVRWLFTAYSALRRPQTHKFILNLLLLMLPSQMPELMMPEHTKYLTDALRFDLTSNRDVAVHVENTLSRCLADKYRLVDKVFHATKHAK